MDTHTTGKRILENIRKISYLLIHLVLGNSNQLHANNSGDVLVVSFLGNHLDSFEFTLLEFVDVVGFVNQTVEGFQVLLDLLLELVSLNFQVLLEVLFLLLLVLDLLRDLVVALLELFLLLLALEVLEVLFDLVFY